MTGLKETVDCPECKRPQRIMRVVETRDGGCDVVGHCILFILISILVSSIYRRPESLGDQRFAVS